MSGGVRKVGGLPLRLDVAPNGQNKNVERNVSVPDATARMLVTPTDEGWFSARESALLLDEEIRAGRPAATLPVQGDALGQGKE